MMSDPAVMGTVYALTDPRDGTTRYIGQTIQTLPERLRGRYAPRVRAWIAELRSAGLAPQITAVRENVPADDLLAAESEEITRIIAAGGTLLNELSTALGRKLNYRREDAERVTAERDAWADLADAALDALGGPLPPGDLPDVQIPDSSWCFMSAVDPGRRERMESLRASDPRETFYERHRILQAMEREQEEAGRELRWATHGAWGRVNGLGGDRFGEQFDLNVSVVAETPCGSRAEASRHLALIAWYMVAVHPWHHLAQLGGLATDDGAFIAWAGRDAEVREALEFLARRRQLGRLPYQWYSPFEKGPGHLLGAVAAAYSGVTPKAITSHIVEVLGKAADDHQLTRPMADLLMRLNPRALDAVFGKDIAAEIDRDLGLAAGTSGRVLRAVVERIVHVNDPLVRRAADRSAHTFPVTSLPEYGGWCGPSALAARAVSASLVRTGLADPDGMTADEYLAEVRELWTSRPWPRAEAA